MLVDQDCLQLQLFHSWIFLYFFTASQALFSDARVDGGCL